jgi:hypothetical protein
VSADTLACLQTFHLDEVAGTRFEMLQSNAFRHAFT